jgi:hypothetical protein
MPFFIVRSCVATIFGLCPFTSDDGELNNDLIPILRIACEE